jgi:DNA-binding IclR family transcriptional regulator
MRLVKGVLHRCLEAIEVMSQRGGWQRLSDLASALELQKGATHRLLIEMRALGWVEQDAETERYRLTLKLALLGQQYLRGSGLLGVIQPVVDDVAERCHELVRLTVVQGDALYWLASAQGAPPGLMYQPALYGKVRLHATANGKAWLATMDDDTATRLAIASGLSEAAPAGRPFGARALRNVRDLLHELAETRQRGYGRAVEEAEPGVKALAVAVRSAADGRVLGTMSIAGPLLRIPDSRDEALLALLGNAATTLGRVWQHDASERAPGKPRVR